jgi:hypothetical protein
MGSNALSANDKAQLYIVGNGGMGTTISMPVEQYAPEIKACVIKMLSVGELVRDEERSLLLEKSIWVYYLSLSTSSKEEA